ncbi:Imm1 family immunity protein [Kitasatospora sp. NPDC088351]|uniref:Imm1 family immunity protein n=1 Tax=unclassified Kitasatospora TaxID=2633591 RepID=UPI00343B8FB6
MILHIQFDREEKYPSSQKEADRLISEALHVISVKEIVDGEYVSGGMASFCYTEPQGRFPSTYLRVSVNELSGYGALMWSVDGQAPRKGGIYDYTWISDNPSPPEIDSQLVSDTYYGWCHDPASAVPLSRIRAAIEEYCRLGTGERPEGINWVTGEINGQRHDRPPFEEEVDENYSEPNWETFFDGAPRPE